MTAPSDKPIEKYRVGERAPPEVRHKLRLTVALYSLLENVTLRGTDASPLAPPVCTADAKLPSSAHAVGTSSNGDRTTAPVLDYIHPEPLTLKLIIEKTGERAFGVLAAFLCLPFLTPIPLPGMSILFGIALAMLGAEIAIRRDRPWLPQKLLNWRLPPKMGPKLIAFVAKLFKPLERIIRPRLLFMQNPVAMAFVGVALMLDGVLLSLPIPPVVPLSNAIPAWLALITILGITEEDGVCLLAGTTLTLGSVAGGIVALVLGWEKVASLWQ